MPQLTENKRSRPALIAKNCDPRRIAVLSEAKDLSSYCDPRFSRLGRFSGSALLAKRAVCAPAGAKIRGLFSASSTSCPSLHPSYARLRNTSMSARGKFIVLEGIDGSGKRTQIEMLARAFSGRGIHFSQIGFPNYSGFFGKLVARFLNGEFGSLETVDPHFSALLYAGDRLESKPALDAALAAGHTVLADRYVGSNLAHQGARVPREKREEFLAWLRELEYRVYALPAEDLVIYLRVPAAEAHRLVAEKGARGYTNRKRDLQEANLAHLEAASRLYDDLAQQKNWVKIECFDAASRVLRSPEAIHREILATIDARIFPALHASR
jgi:dTMP kinase